jgi:hypothetical protein
MPARPGPNVVVGVCGAPSARIQYASLSPAKVSSSSVPALTDNDVSVTSPSRALVSCSS